MSDQPGQQPDPPQAPPADPPQAPPVYAPPPAVYAPQPPAAYPPQTPPPYPPQPGAVPPTAPGAPDAPKKKSRAWIWVLLVVFLLLCCVGTAIAGVIGWAAYDAANTSATVKKADDAYAKALSRIDAAASGVGTLEQAATTTATVALGEANVLLADARTSITTLADDEGRATYLQGLDEAVGAVETLGSITAESSGKTRFLEVSGEGLRLYRAGTAKLTAAIGLANKRSYRSAGAEARKAKSSFVAARAKMVEADAMEPAADLEKAIAYVDLQLKKVGYLSQMSGYGVSGKTSAYNKVVPKYNAVNTQIDRLEEPRALTDPAWATQTLESLQTQFSDHLTKSAELVDRARALLSGVTPK